MRSVPQGEATDWVVVNTCTVTGRADQEARQLIRRLSRESPRARIVVTGCYAQRAPAELAGLPAVVAVYGTAERDRIAAHLAADRSGVVVGDARAKRPFAGPVPLSFGRTRALLKVQDGCDSFCAYCVVPYVRGRSRSLPLPEALARGERLLEAGFEEIVVTGADLGSYGRDLGEPRLLSRLVSGLLALGPRHRVRLSSIEPNKLDPAVVEMVGAAPRLCRHLHLPLQSGSDSVLRAMRRPYAAADYASLLDRILQRGPVGIGADVIVGHPGEGDREFAETRSFLRDLPVTSLHLFRYSPRPGTASLRLEAPAPDGGTARARSEELRALGEVKHRTFLLSLVGARLPVLAESTRGEGPVLGRSDVNALVRFHGAGPWRGIAEALVTGVEGDACTGTLVEAARPTPAPRAPAASR